MDVVTGEFCEWRTDVAVPGVLPLVLRRVYASGRKIGPGDVVGLFGPGWRDSWSVHLRRAGPRGETIAFWDDGRGLIFDTPSAPGFERLEATHRRTPNLVLRGTREQPVLHDRASGIRQHFEWFTLEVLSQQGEVLCQQTRWPAAGVLQTFPEGSANALK